MDPKGAAPRPGEAMFAAALAHHQAGQLDPAADLYREVMARAAGHVEARVNLGLVLQRQGAAKAALAAYDAALALDPELAAVHNNRGVALQTLGRFEAAAASHQAAIALRPGSVDAHLNLGAALQRLGRFEAAAASCRTALALRSDHAGAHANLGLALLALDRPGEALGHHRAALSAAPDSPEFHSNLGLALQALGDPSAATAAFERAIALRPAFAEGHTHLGVARLLTGDFAQGWRHYEWRLARTAIPQPIRPGRRWNGGNLAGKSVLLQTEQGLGDAVQFIRYAPMVASRGGRVLVSCRPPLRRLFETVDGVAEMIDEAAPTPAFDCWAPLLSLPALFGTTQATIPAEVPYLRADPALIAAWGERLAGLNGQKKVGVAWRGSPDHPNDRSRSIAAGQFARILSVSGLAVVSLQIDARAEELDALGVAAFDAGPQLGDFADTAALIANLDLVISVDTALAHLAGALGAPAWTLIGFAPDWRWLLGREDSPWYPSMRLFRQPQLGDWDSVTAAVRDALARRAGA